MPSQVIWGLLGVIVGSVLATIKDLTLDWWHQRRNKRYAAVRIVSLLDVFIDRCRDVATDEGEEQFQAHGHGTIQPTVRAPECPDFPDDIVWNSLNPQLVYRIMALPALLSETQAAASYALAYASPPDGADFIQQRRYGFAKLGLLTLEIANDLRKAAKLAARLAEDAEWSSAVKLPQVIKSIEENRAAAGQPAA